jgi:hypothetical protein
MLSLVNKAYLHGCFFWHFYGLVPPNQFYNCDLRFQISQVLAYASPRSPTKSHKSIRIDVFTFLLPPFWSKFFRLCEVLRIKMIPICLIIHNCPFFDWDVTDIVIFGCYSEELHRTCAIKASCLILNPF